jgi:hypothetical protein
MLALAATAALVGCKTNQGDNAVLIVHNQVPQANCVLTADSSSGSRSAGIMDLDLWHVGQVAFGYELTPLVENFSIADLSNNDLVRRRTAIVQGAHVDITIGGTTLSSSDISSLDAAGLLHFDSRFSGSVPPNQGFATFGFEVIPPGVFDAIKTKFATLEQMPNASIPPVDMLVQVVIYGTVNDGSFETDPFTYPVTTCDGCLTNILGNCTNLPSGGMIRTGGACQLLQDETIDCCIDTTKTNSPLLCPAQMITPPV